MGYRFTDDDDGKRLVSPAGAHLGTVNYVDEEERATVDRDHDADLTETMREILGWEDDDANEIRGEHVDRAEEDRLLLREH